MSYIDIFILSLIEGLTEFLPVSSTGHLILATSLLQIPSTDFVKAFQVIIQFGAILAVVTAYKDRFLTLNSNTISFYKKIILGSLPVMALGFLLKDKIDQFLESPLIVAYALIAGGVFFLIIDKIKPNPENQEISLKNSFIIGILQCFALIPGVSRSGATIVAAQFLKYPKKMAAEFSFFLAIPTLTAATLYKTYKIKDIITFDTSLHLIAGIVLSYIFALIAIKSFIKFVSQHGFKYFGLYRIILGILVIISMS